MIVPLMGWRASLGVQAIRRSAATVREHVEAAELHADPFPHIVVDGLFPALAFRQLAAAIPAPSCFAADGKTKLDLDIRDNDPHFAASPEVTRAVWRTTRDTIFRGTIAPVLAHRLREGLEAKYAFLFGPEIGREVVGRGFTSTDGRIQGRRPGYKLKPHLDSAHFGVTCLLYFSPGDAENSGALSLFRPARDPEIHDVSTYYPAEEEGIEAEVAKTIPIRKNLLVAFLNVRNALHGVSIDRRSKAADYVRYAYQCQIVPSGFAIGDIYARLGDVERKRWQRLVERREAASGAGPAAQ
jgi:hypothetical protein